jgi:hypothetical protein
MMLLCKKVVVSKSREVKTGCSLAESPKEGSKRAVLPMMMKYFRYTLEMSPEPHLGLRVSIRYWCPILTGIDMCQHILVKFNNMKLTEIFHLFSSSYMQKDENNAANRSISASFVIMR